MKKLLLGAIGTVFILSLIAGPALPTASAAYGDITVPTWSTTTTESVLGNLGSAIETSGGAALDFIVNYVFPILLIVGLFGLGFYLFARLRRGR